MHLWGRQDGALSSQRTASRSEYTLTGERAVNTSTTLLPSTGCHSLPAPSLHHRTARGPRHQICRALQLYRDR
eukprot:scaffold22113_cov64-Phaeocystis_antarctica.AAC.3